MSKKSIATMAILVLAAFIAIAPLMIVKDSAFAGADESVGTAVEEMHQGFQPWFHPLWKPPGGETESLLFALQAALGSSVLFYCIGYLKGRSDARKTETILP